MARYVDSDKLLQVLHEQFFDGDWESKVVCSIIKCMETSNVRKDIKGEWINSTHGLICSACGTFQAAGNRYFNYCPICGADMRGDKK